MSKKTPKAAVLRTTAKHVWLRLIPGCVLLCAAMLFFLSMSGSFESRALGAAYETMAGLGGNLFPLLPWLLLFLAAKLILSAYRRVTAREAWLICALYVLALAFLTLVTTVQGKGDLMSFFATAEAGGCRSYADYLQASRTVRYGYHQAYGGGVLGMLLAYPLWRTLGRTLAAVLTALLFLGCVWLLLQLNLRPLLDRVSARMSERRTERPGRAVEEETEEEENTESPARTAQQPTRSVYSTPAQEAWPPLSWPQENQPRQETQRRGQTQFYSVSNEQPYEEAFPRQWQQNEPAPAGRDIWVSQNPAGDGAWHADGGESGIAPQTEPMAAPAEEETAPAERPSSGRMNQHAEEAAASADTLPENTPERPPRHRRSRRAAEEDSRGAEEQPEAVLPPVAPARETHVSLPPRAADEDAGRPADSQMTEQVRLHDAKPVTTAPAVNLGGERIPIRQQARPETETAGEPAPDELLDGTKRKKSELSVRVQQNIRYEFPPIDLLNAGKPIAAQDHSQEDAQRAAEIEATLESFNVQAKVMQIMHGPAITRFAIQIAPGIRVSRVTGMADDLAVNLKTRQVRMEAPIQGTNYIGIEVPNRIISTVTFREVLDSPEMRANPSPLSVSLGKDIAGTPIVCDLSRMPHLLIAGATGSGKSVCIHSIVCSILYRATPNQVRLIMIDPKQVELSLYNGVPHLLIPVVTDVRKAAGALGWAVQEMEDRYARFSENNVRNLTGYNKLFTKPEDQLPNIVIIIDEMADLMVVCRKDVESYINRLAALARAAGIYMVLATQRPSVDVITGVIKNNIPGRIAFAVTSGTDSRTILDQFGAEKLMGKGDMLYKPSGQAPSRVQGSFVSDEEVEALTKYICARYQADYDENVIEHLQNAANSRQEGQDAGEADFGDGGEESGQVDDMLQEAIQIAIEDGQVSTSMLQRKLRVGYARAGRLVDEMEKRGIVGQQDGSKPRKTIITREQYYEMFSDEEP